MSPTASTPTGRNGTRRSRPREVTWGGMQAVAGSVMALVLLVTTAQQLNGPDMTNALRDVVDSEQAATLGLTVESARQLLRVTIMGLAVLSVASLVLGVYVLRRHRASRVVLTVIGGVVGVLTLLAGPAGWLVTVYIAVSVFLIWSKPARAWFADGTSISDSGAGGPGDHRPGGNEPGVPGSPFGPPQGPRRDVDGILPPPPPGPPPQGPDDGPPPPPPPSRH